LKKTWKPTTAGILNIISGAISVIGVMVFAIALTSASAWTSIMDTIPPEDLPFAAPLINAILIIFLVISVIEVVLPIIGGILALQRTKWGWALAGSIISIIGVFPLGVLSTIFVSMGKDEFE